MLKNELLELGIKKGISFSIEEMSDISIEDLQNKIITIYKNEEVLRANEKEEQRIQENKKAADKRFFDILNGKRW